MNATQVVTAIKATGERFNALRTINTRWIFVDDGACKYYLDSRSVAQTAIDILASDKTEDRSTAYSLFCTATTAAHYEDLPKSSQRDARETLEDERAKNTGGW
jgi:hypothetical protein